MAQAVDRTLYMPAGVDQDKMRAHAEERALVGERVVVHDHAKGEECALNCYLIHLILNRTPWRPHAPSS